MAMHAIHSMYKSAAEMVIPTRKQSAFRDKGVLTPDEFVQAGDELVKRSPYWYWEGGEPTRRKSYLPSDKQYLMARNVPCKEQPTQDEIAEVEIVHGKDGEDAWTTLGESSNMKSSDASERIADIDGEETSLNDVPASDANEDLPDISDLDGDDDVVADPDDPAAVTYLRAEEPPEDCFVKNRRYDLSISYDKYYQTPRIWLFGYDENHQPLEPSACLNDISTEHAKKTVTIETHPHSGLTCASIHPCKHASLMKTLSDSMAENGNEPTVEQYMVIFLKFVSTIVPTVDYDFTGAAHL